MQQPAAQFTFRIQNGMVPSGTRNAVTETLRKFEGKTVTMMISEEKRTRSSRQNRFYFGVVLPLVVEMFREAGSDASKDDIHAFLKSEVGNIKKEILIPGGEHREVAGSSTELGTREWEDWLERIRAWAARWDYIIPLPNEND